MVEGWMVSVFFGVVTIVSGYAVHRNTVAKQGEKIEKQDKKIEELEKFKNEKTPLLMHLSKVEEAYGKKIDFLAKENVELKTKIANVPTMEEVRNEFVSKEMYYQMQKHIDEKFQDQNRLLGKILNKIEEAA